MRRINIRRPDEWAAFDRAIGWILLLLVIILVVIWFINRDTLLFNCCNDEREPVVAEQLEPEPVAPVVAPTPPPVEIPPPPPAPTEPAQFGLSIADGTVQLTGVLDSEATKQSLIGQVRQRLPGVQIIDQLTVSDEVIPPEDTLALQAVLADINADDRLSMAWGPQSLRVSGVVESDARKQTILESAESNGFTQSLYANVNLIDQLEVAQIGPSCAEILQAAQIEFGSGSAELTPQGEAELSKLVPCLQADQYLAIGHTDSDGDEALNRALSLARAESALAFLVTRGVLESKFETQGAGESAPIADNSSAAGKARNRRIEFRAVD